MDYLSRIEDLHKHLELEFGHKDRQATEILLASRMTPEITGRSSPWILIETDYPSINTENAWFGWAHAQSLALARIRRTQLNEEMMQEWLMVRRSGMPMTFVDAEWRHVPKPPETIVWSKVGWRRLWTRTYQILLANCVRVRVEHPRTSITIINSTSLTQVSQASLEANRLANRVLDNQFRERRNGNIAGRDIPKAFNYWCERLQQLCPMQTDWEALLTNLSTTAYNLSVLRNDGSMYDWVAVERIMRDTVPYMTRYLYDIADKNQNPQESPTSFKNRHKRYGEASREMIEEMKRICRMRVLIPKRHISVHEAYRWHPSKYHAVHEDWINLMDREKRILL